MIPTYEAIVFENFQREGRISLADINMEQLLEEIAKPSFPLQNVSIHVSTDTQRLETVLNALKTKNIVCLTLYSVPMVQSIASVIAKFLTNSTVSKLCLGLSLPQNASNTSIQKDHKKAMQIIFAATQESSVLHLEINDEINRTFKDELLPLLAHYIPQSNIAILEYGGARFTLSVENISLLNKMLEEAPQLIQVTMKPYEVEVTLSPPEAAYYRAPTKTEHTSIEKHLQECQFKDEEVLEEIENDFRRTLKGHNLNKTPNFNTFSELLSFDTNYQQVSKKLEQALPLLETLIQEYSDLEYSQETTSILEQMRVPLARVSAIYNLYCTLEQHPLCNSLGRPSSQSTAASIVGTWANVFQTEVQKTLHLKAKLAELRNPKAISSLASVAHTLTPAAAPSMLPSFSAQKQLKRSGSSEEELVENENLEEKAKKQRTEHRG